MSLDARGGIRAGRTRLVLLAALALGLIVIAGASSAGFKQGPGAPFSTVGAPYFVATGDVNGDGIPDIVVLEYDSTLGHEYLRTFVGNGLGGFRAKGTPTQLDADADAFTLGDVNGDHKLDAVVTNYQSDTLSVFLGDGKGDFTQHGGDIQLHGGSQPDTAVIADLNGDGKPDLVVPNEFVAGVDFLEGDGNGGFAPFPGSPFLYGNSISANDFADGPVQAVVGDFDGDHIPDVAVVTYYNPDNQGHGTVTLLEGNGDGTFTYERSLQLDGVADGIVAGDFNHDGNTDLAVSEGTPDEVQVWLGDGQSNFFPVAPATSTPAPEQIVSGDFNHDGRLDVATIDGATLNGFTYSGVDVLLGDGNGGLAEEPGAPFAVGGLNPGIGWLSTADFNLDKRTDIAAINGNLASADVLLSQGGALPAGTVSSKTLSGIVGATVTINGTNLNTVAAVNFGGPDGAIQTKTASKITVDVPDGAAVGKLTLIGANGTASTTNVFTPIEAPEITSLSPLPGTKVGGIETIKGSHFTGTSSVKFGTVAATSFTVVSDSKITAVVPQGAGATVVVTNPVDSASAPFVLIQKPSVASFTPTHGPANKTQSTTVHVSGADLQGVTSVTFGGVAADPATISVSVDGESLQVATPAGAQTGPIVVTNVAGSYSTNKNDDPDKTFTVDPKPAITSLSATSGATGDTVTVNGTNLVGITEVDFAGVPGTNLDTTNAPASVSVQVPADAGVGKVTAIGTNGVATSTQTFTPHIAPILDGFSPAGGALPGAKITIGGYHFTGTRSVTFAAASGTVSGTFTVASDTSLSVKIPATAVTGTVTVTNAYGDAGQSYYVIQTPVLAATGSFAPAAGGAGQQVAITGQHFGGTTSVTFDGTSADFTLNSDTSITATVPAGFTSGVVAVTNAAGTATTTDKFTEVTITDFSPPTTDGTAGTFTVDGTGLSAVTKIVFAGTFGEQVAPNEGGTDTQITFPIQPCGSTGTFQLLVPGADAVVSATQLTYTGPACS